MPAGLAADPPAERAGDLRPANGIAAPLNHTLVSTDAPPAIAQWRRHAAGGVAVLLLALLIAGAQRATARSELGQSAYATGVSAIPDTFATAPTALSAPPTPAVVTAPLVGQQWWYNHDDDGMSRGKSHTARVVSVNTVDFGFPYGGEQHATLTLRTHPRFGRDVLFSIERGQLLCPSYDGCTVLVRFDDQAAQSFSANGPADNSTETLFISNYARFLAAMRKATRVRIAANVYQQGAPSFEFDVSGFSVASYVPPAIGPAAPPTKKRTRRSCDPNDPGCVTGVPGEIP